MPTFELKRRLPSSRVDKDLIVELENYMLDQAQQVFGLAGEAARSKYSVTIEESFGTETLSSATELRSGKFADTTVSIRLQIDEWKPRCKLDIYFHTDSLFSRVEVKSEGANGREFAIGFFAGTLRHLESRRSNAWFFHPNLFFAAVLFGLTPISVAMLLFAFSAESTSILAAALVALPLALATYYVGGKLNPYTSFTCRRTEIREKTWAWFVTGMAGFILFGPLLALLRKKLFGF